MADDGEDLGAPPEADAIARAVRKSRIAKNLFEIDEPVKLGRYQLLERVGAGGTGVVWGAWDPELDRRVAIKLIKQTLSAARERIVFEGKALAKLAHPNVVAVHDVGEVGDQIYLVMEWVKGKTLRGYCTEPRTVREIVVAYRAAAEGLQAAHAAGVIHRDFKPDNAIRGDDGRVRVLDFGLAGTPRYMAPEQAAGAEVTAASDQYAFCVAFAEALRHRGPIPRWLDAIVTRGTAAEPGARFASMAELLRALARDPATIWRRRAIAGGALALAGATFVVGSARGSHITPCDGGEAEITSVWSTARTPTIAHLRALGTYGAVEADPVATGLDAYGKDWADAHRAACLAHERHELTDAVYERSLGCLARARTSYETVIDVLGSTTAPRLGNAIAAARSLPAADRCALDSAASIIPPPPRVQVEAAAALSNEIERVRVLAATDDPRGGPAASEVVTRAAALDYVPLLARAKLALGLALLGQQNAKAAIPVLNEAWVAAIDAFDDVTLVEAYARELYARSVITKPTSDGGSMLALVEHVAGRSGTPGAFARALLFNNLGAVRLGAGDPDGAREWFDRSLREPGKRDAELIATYANRALVTDDPAERDRLFARARQMLAGLLGENHRKTLDVRFQAAFFIGDAARAEAELRELCDVYRRFHAEVAADTIANCYFELGWLAEARGDREATRRAMAIVASGEGLLLPMARAYLLALDGKPAEAIVAARRVAEEFREQSWARFNAADAYRFVAEREAELGQRDAAVTDARAAIALFDQLPHLAKMPHFQRRVARTQSVLTRRSP